MPVMCCSGSRVARRATSASSRAASRVVDRRRRGSLPPGLARGRCRARARRGARRRPRGRGRRRAPAARRRGAEQRRAGARRGRIGDMSGIAQSPAARARVAVVTDGLTRGSAPLGCTAHRRRPAKGPTCPASTPTSPPLSATPRSSASTASRRASSGNILAKLEFYNPASSVKDRLGIAIVDAAEASGELQPGGTIVEATSGNTGIALAMVGAARGYRVVLAMPSSMSIERRLLLKAYGAELVLTDPRRRHEGRAREGRGDPRRDSRARSSPASSRTRRTSRSTARPPPRRSSATPTARSTTSSPASARAARSPASARCSRSACPEAKVIAVEPADSPLLTKGTPGPHKIQGIGPNFVPADPRPERHRRGHRRRVRRRDRDRARRRHEGRHPRRHLVGRRRLGRPAGRRAPRGRGQEHRRDHPVVRRALPVDRAVRAPARGLSPAPRRKAPPWPAIHSDITSAFGDTPLVRLNALTEGLGGEVLAKLEFYNPGSSVKDRLGVALVEAAEASGELKPGRHDRRVDERQHRHRARAHRRGARLPGDPHDARVDVEGAPDAAQGLRRRARAHRSVQGHDRGRRDREAHRRRDSRRGARAPVRASRRTPRSTAAPPPRRSGATPTDASTTSSRDRARAARSPASARCSRSATPT